MREDEALRTVRRAITPTGELVLRQRTAPDGQLHYEGVVNGIFLFSTYNRESEKILARAAIRPGLALGRPLHVLIGGLGAGYTLQATLEYEQVATVTVVEREPSIADWCRDYFSAYNDGALEDPRIALVIGDFVSFTRTTDRRFDAVCLDLDNGPDWLSCEGNMMLYEESGLKRIRKIMNPGAGLAVWSSAKSAWFEDRLKAVFGTVSVDTVIAREMDRELDYYIYSTRRASP
jgi:spermidine synthase